MVQMLKVERKIFERVIIQIASSTNIRELIREFSLRRVLSYSLLEDISKGKDSPNYDILNKVAQDKKISEQFIVEQAKFILSCLALDQPEEDYYKILNVSHRASAEEIRSNWLNLMKIHHPDRVGQGKQDKLDITKKLNEAYEVLRHPIKRIEYDLRCFPALPVVVSSSWTFVSPSILLRPGLSRLKEIASRKFIYSASLIIFIFAVIFYLTKSGFLGSAEEKGTFAKRVEDKRYRVGAIILPTPEIPPVPAIREVGRFPLKESEKTLIARETGAEEILENKSLRSEETPKLVMKEPPTTKPKIKEKGVVQQGSLQGVSSTPKENKGLITTQEEIKRISKLKEILKGKLEGKEYVLEGVKYVVKKGDNLGKIAREFNISVRDLKFINNLQTSKLAIGDVLIITRYKTETKTQAAEPLGMAQEKIQEEKVFVQEQSSQPKVTPEGIKQAEIKETKLKSGNSSRSILRPEDIRW
jgi:LysM repeat protein/DnaJ-domain-containing protein 1